MHRFFVKSVIEENQKIIDIDDKDDVRHISRALRVQLGEALEICDASGREFIVKVKSLVDALVSCEIVELSDTNRESNIHLDLYQGLAKGSKMDVIIQKSVELGVNTIIPMMTKRSIVKLDRKSETKKIERWQKISDEAAKQSKRSVLPEVSCVMDIKDVVLRDDYDLMVIAYELESTKKLKEVLLNGSYKKIAVLIGPEGGFEESEVEVAVLNGVIPISLGKRILRTETAGITCISIMQYELGDIGI